MADGNSTLTALIKATPEASLRRLEMDVSKSLSVLESIRITNQKQLDSAIDALTHATYDWDRIEAFRQQLNDAVSNSIHAMFHLDDVSVGIVIKSWPQRTRLEMAIRNVKNARASYLAAEAAKARQLQLDADARQREINEKAAREAAASAKKAGADKQTIEDIKTEIRTTPAPLVTSSSLDNARSAGVSVRFNYTAKLTDAAEFLQDACDNPILLKTLACDAKVCEAIEKAFTPLAKAQREAFSFPGMTYAKTPVDVQRGR